MHAYTTEIVRSHEKFTELRSAWNVLLAASVTNTIFLTWEWAHSWWEVYGKDAELFIVTVRDTQGKLVGLAPLCVRKSRYYSLPVNEMTFLGANHADRQDFIISAQEVNGDRVVGEIVAAIEKEAKAWDIVQLDQIPEVSLALYLNATTSVYPECEESSQCPFVQIEGSWDDYQKSLSKKFHRDLKHKYNRLGRFGSWKYSSNREAGTKTGVLIDAVVRMEENSRKNAKNKTFFADASNRGFFSVFAKLSADNGWLDSSSLSVDDTVVAYLLGFNYNGRYYAYNMAFIEDYHQASPGKILLNEKLKWCFEHHDRIREFDFLRGGTYIKSLWTSQQRQHYRVVFFKRSLYSQLLRLAVFKARPLIKSFMKYRMKKMNNEMADQDGS